MSVLYDVVIAGGGPAGAAVGIDLARSGLKALIADTGSARRFPMGETLPPDALHELSRLGCRASFLRDAHPPSLGMCSLWASSAPQFRDSFTSPVGLGWILDRGRFDATLLAEAESAGVDLRRATRVANAFSENGHWIVKLDCSGQDLTLRARFLVDATGRAAIVARRLGARRLYLDQLTAVYAAFPSSGQSSARMSAIESFSEGWWYSACLPDRRTVVGLFSDSDRVRAKALASPANWLRLLGESCLARKFVHGDSAELCLTVCSCASQIGQCGGARWLAVGDAASAWDPLASAGITMALRTGREASTAIQADLAGDHGSIDRYCRCIFDRTQHYIAKRTNQYCAEERWPESPFWKRRRAEGGQTMFLSRASLSSSRPLY